MVVNGRVVVELKTAESINKAHEAFDAEGKLKDPKQQESIAKIAKRLVDVVSRVRAAGAMPLTRTPYRISSLAMITVNAPMPAFAAP